MKVHKSFENFDPKDYLNEYYSKVGLENQELLRFHAEASKIIFSKESDDRLKVLELGGGPTIYQLISISNHKVEIDFSDFLTTNTDEVRSWINGEEGSMNWDPFILESLKLENVDFADENIQDRKRKIKDKIKNIFHCDIKSEDPVGVEHHSFYDIVGTQFVSESITDSKEEWSNLIDNCLSPLKVGGFLVMCALVGASNYKVGDQYFPAVNLDSQEIISKISLMKMDILMTHFVSSEHKEQGYGGIFMILARKT